MTSEEPELYIEDLNLDKSFFFIVKPSTGLSQLCKTFDRFKPEELDFRLNAFLNRCIRKRWVHLVGEPDECNLSGDDLLKTMHGTITLVPDGLCLMSAIKVDRLECFYCCTRNCHYKVQCEQCEQFNCGAWIRAKEECAFCRKVLKC